MDNFIALVPTRFRDVYRKNWSTIRQRTTKGRLKDVYHFPLSPADKIPGKLDEVLANYNKSIKLNVAFGYVMTCKPTGEVRFFHPSNNTMALDTFQLVTGPSDVKKVKDNIEREDLLEIARKSRVSTVWQVEDIVCIRFDVVKLSY